MKTTNKKIIIAPLNWGLGHATRCIPIINALLENNFIPIIASDGNALEFLRKEFPNLEYIAIPTYNISYHRNIKLGLLFQLPTILKAVREEKIIINNFIKENKDLNPADPIPSHELPRWSVASTSIIFFFFAMLIGAMLAATFGGPVGSTGWIFGAVALVLCLFYFRPTTLSAVDLKDYNTTNWGIIWVIVSGAVFVGIGLGVMAAVINSGG